jgi:small subunit ribosomal protein S6
MSGCLARIRCALIPDPCLLTPGLVRPFQIGIIRRGPQACGPGPPTGAALVFLPEAAGLRRTQRKGVVALAQRAYEAMVILNPNVGEEALTAATQRVADQIAARGGQVEKVDTWGRRRLYYPIKHLRDGQYVVYAFNAEPAAVRELEASWRIQEDVLRHLVVRREA